MSPWVIFEILALIVNILIADRKYSVQMQLSKKQKILSGF